MKKTLNIQSLHWRVPLEAFNQNLNDHRVALHPSVRLVLFILRDILLRSASVSIPLFWKSAR